MNGLVTIFGLPADGVVLFGTSIVCIVVGFIWSEARSCVKTERVSKGKIAQYKRTHSHWK